MEKEIYLGQSKYKKFNFKDYFMIFGLCMLIDDRKNSTAL